MTNELMNQLWDAQETKMVEAVKGAKSPHEFAGLVPLMLQTTMLGKSAHVRNGGRRVLAAVLDKLVELGQLVSKPMRQYNERELEAIANLLGDWQILPNGTEGYRTAEVTLGGVDTNELSSKTMDARKVPGLYFIGEVVDVTGWLGGYNFQWAWSSGWVAGQYC